MSGRVGGLSRFGYPHRSLEEIAERWEVVIGAERRDEHGPFVDVHPMGCAAADAVELARARAQLLTMLARRLAPDTASR